MRIKSTDDGYRLQTGYPADLPHDRDGVDDEGNYLVMGFEELQGDNGVFAAAEDRCYGSDPDANVGARLYEALLIAYRIRFVPGTDVRSGIDRLSVIARVAIEASDPYAALYYYFCYDLGTRMADMPASV